METRKTYRATSARTAQIGDAHAVPAVCLTGVSKHYGTVTAVDDLSLEIAPGEVVALLGPNGAGKTTTIDMLLGLADPDDGTAAVFSLPPRQAISRGLISAVMQSGGLLKEYTVRETVEVTATLFGLEGHVDAALTRAGITGIADRRVGTCSGGEQQRLRFAMALLPDPALLILDEPTTGMDVSGRRSFWNAIRDDAAQGRTVIFATHYLEEADAYADRIVLVSAGRVVADGSPAQIKAVTAGRTVRATLPGARAEDLLDLPSEQSAPSVHISGDTVLIHGADSDAIARYLLTHTCAHDLEITTRNLEDAFIALTGSNHADGATP